MVNKVSKRCNLKGCNTLASYGSPGTRKREFCVRHAQLGMVDVVNKRCGHKECQKYPTFGYIHSNNREFCTDHAKEGMVNIVGKRCARPGCTNRATCGRHGKPYPDLCTVHANEVIASAKAGVSVLELDGGGANSVFIVDPAVGGAMEVATGAETLLEAGAFSLSSSILAEVDEHAAKRARHDPPSLPSLPSPSLPPLPPHSLSLFPTQSLPLSPPQSLSPLSPSSLSPLPLPNPSQLYQAASPTPVQIVGHMVTAESASRSVTI